MSSIENLSQKYHDTMGNLAIRRMEQAGSVLQEMDRKDAFYQQLGREALAELPDRSPKPMLDVDLEVLAKSPPPVATPPRPKTLLERRADRRLAKRSERAEWDNIHLWRQNSTFGPNPRESVYSLGEIVMGHSKGGVADRKSALAERVDELRHGPAVPGVGRHEKKERLREVKRDVRAGKINASEGKIKRAEIKALPLRLGESGYRLDIKGVRRSGSSVRTTARHLYAPHNRGEKWTISQATGSPATYFRDRRRSRAISRVIKNHERMKRHGGPNADTEYAKRLR